MKSQKPIIGITHSIQQSKITIMAIKLAIMLAGGKPISITTKTKQELKYHGLVIYGGVDIDPKYYHKSRKQNYPYDFARDTLEFNTLVNAIENNVPVLGICRGAQLMNIVRGGSLHEDIRKIHEKVNYPSTLLGFIFFRKKMIIKNDSLLYRIIKKNNIKVNSIHSQAINKLGSEFKVTAYEHNKIIQCIEDQNKIFFMGVQFHPEFLIYRRAFLKIFKTLVNAAKNLI